MSDCAEPAAPVMRFPDARAARIAKFEREQAIVGYLNRGASVAEIAADRRRREAHARHHREILARRMPAPPEEFAAIQVSRLNEAPLVAYSAMTEAKPEGGRPGSHDRAGARPRSRIFRRCAQPVRPFAHRGARRGSDCVRRGAPLPRGVPNGRGDWERSPLPGRRARRGFRDRHAAPAIRGKVLPGSIPTIGASTARKIRRKPLKRLILRPELTRPRRALAGLRRRGSRRLPPTAPRRARETLAARKIRRNVLKTLISRPGSRRGCGPRTLRRARATTAQSLGLVLMSRRGRTATAPSVPTARKIRRNVLKTRNPRPGTNRPPKRRPASERPTPARLGRNRSASDR